MKGILVESDSDFPLVWINVYTRGGSAADPQGQEGLHRHAYELARRGTRSRDRATIDRQLDALGASIDPLVHRSYAGFAAVCLRDKLEPVIELLAEILGEPAFDPVENDKLVRESLDLLDEIRDDDADLASRWFHRSVLPGYLFARTGLGTAESIASLSAGAARRAFEAAMKGGERVIGFAGDVDDDTAAEMAERLRPAGSGGAAGPALAEPQVPAAARRVILVDKPKRTQCQIVLGHAAPRYGSDEYLALLPAECAFGGSFTSRLMQEVRVKRGWSYGAYTQIARGRAPLWLRTTLAPGAAQTADALALVHEMIAEMATGGLEPDEAEFSIRYLCGQNAFARATARRRLYARMEPALVGVRENFVVELPDALRALSLESINAAVGRWFRPAELCTVVVGTADAMLPAIEKLGIGPVEVVAWDEY